MRRCTPISFKPPKRNHVVFIKSKWWMARWNNKMLWMACCWLTVIESPSSILPSFAFLSPSLWFFPHIHHFQTLPGWKNWQSERLRSEERNRAGQDPARFKNTPCGNSKHALEHREHDLMLESNHSPTLGVQVSYSCSGPTKKDDTRADNVPWLAEAAARAQFPVKINIKSETLNQSIRWGNATSHHGWCTSEKSGKDLNEVVEECHMSDWCFHIISETTWFVKSKQKYWAKNV